MEGVSSISIFEKETNPKITMINIPISIVIGRRIASFIISKFPFPLFAYCCGSSDSDPDASGFSISSVVPVFSVVASSAPVGETPEFPAEDHKENGSGGRENAAALGRLPESASHGASGRDFHRAGNCRRSTWKDRSASRCRIPETERNGTSIP